MNALEIQSTYKFVVEVQREETPYLHSTVTVLVHVRLHHFDSPDNERMVKKFDTMTFSLIKMSPTIYIDYHTLISFFMHV